jgi:exoribonuclease R
MADLRAIAHQVMLEEGFAPDVPPAAVAEARVLESWRPADGAALRDMRELLWSSIDNLESRDLDQIEYAERQPNGDICLLVGIADVDALAPENSAIDRHAADNTTSVYAGVVTFPMLPERLSTDLTSLIEGVDR